MYINRNTDAGNEGGAIPTSLADGLKEKFASSFAEVETDESDDEGGKGSEEGEADSGEGNSIEPKGKQENNKGKGDDDGEHEEDSPLSYLAKQYGVDLEEDEDFKDLDLSDDSVDTIKTFFDKRENKVKQQAINELFEAAPVVKDLIEHLQKGGTISTWKEEQQVKEFNLTFEEDDIEGKSNFLIDVYKQKGLTEKRAKLLVEALKDDDELDSEVEKEIKTIKTTREKEVLAKKQKEEDDWKAEQKAIAETVEKVSNIVKKGTLINNFVIPEQERKQFNEFILSEDLSNKYEKLSYEQRLFMDYMVFKDFKLKALESKAAAPSTRGNKPRVTLKSGGSSGSGKKDDGLSLEDLKALSQKLRL